MRYIFHIIHSNWRICKYFFLFQIMIWIISAVYNIPLLIIFDTFVVSEDTSEEIIFCNIRSDIINLRVYFTVNFVLWYALPLITMSVVYAIISSTLWHSGAIFRQQNHVDAISKASSTRLVPMDRDQRLLYNPSSSSSYSDGAAPNSAGGSSHRDSAGSTMCDLCHGNSVNAKSRCCISYTDNIYDRFPLNGDDDLARNPTGNGVFRSDMCDTVQPILPLCEYGNALIRYSSKMDYRRGDDSRQFGKQPFSSRISCDQSNRSNSYEMTYLNSPCLQYQRTPHKRTNGIPNQAPPTVNPKRRSTRQSFHSDTDSSPGQTSAYDTSIQRYQPAMSFRVLSTRRKVVRLLVLVLLTFAICVLPHHVRLLMFYWNVYPVTSFGFTFFPPIAFICMYLNSALNPLLYSLFSESFRRSLRECIRRACQRSKSVLTRTITAYCRRE